MKFAKNMKAIRENRQMTLEEMADFLGTTKQALSRYERGERTPKITAAAKFAELLGVALEDLVGADDDLPEGITVINTMQRQRIPLVGSVAAGEPICDPEPWDVCVDTPIKADYALRVKGDSMEPTYLDGDVIYIHQQDDVDDGTVGVVLCEDSACLKHIYHIDNGLQLVSDNPKYPPMIRTWPEYDSILILGRVVGYTRMFK